MTSSPANTAPEKIGLVSDVHAAAAPLREALGLFRQHGVDTILCPGDIAGYGSELVSCIKLLRAGNVRSILGNHDLWQLSRVAADDLVTDYLGTLPVALELTAGGREIYVVHASPPAELMDGIRLLDENGEIIAERKRQWAESLAGFPFDVLVVGHTHQVFAERLGDVLVINPGSSRFNHTCAILHLPEMKVTVHPLSGQRPQRVWNWGRDVAGDEPGP